jgi:hypothetical protein
MEAIGRHLSSADPALRKIAEGATDGAKVLKQVIAWQRGRGRPLATRSIQGFPAGVRTYHIWEFASGQCVVLTQQEMRFTSWCVVEGNIDAAIDSCIKLDLIRLHQAA